MTPSTDQNDFLPYPTDRVVGTIADVKGARDAIQRLLEMGFSRDDIDILHGEEGLHRLDPTGEEHGFLAQFQRTLVRTAARAEELRHLTRHVDDVREGRFVIMVRATERERRNLAANILGEYGGKYLGYYGRWAWESLDDPKSRE